MQYRTLGVSGPSVSIIGFGAWGIGGRTAANTSYGETDDAVSIAALEVALEEGINFFDTAYAYGDGRSERLIAEIARRHSDRMVIASKVGFVKFNEPQDFRPKTLIKSVEESVSRFNGRPLDLVQLHSVPSTTLRESTEVLGCMRDLQARGLIHHVGLSVKSPQDALSAIRQAQAQDVQIVAIQINLNMMDTRAFDTGLLDYCNSSGIGVIARTPLCFGFLAGQITRHSKFPEGDHRNGWPGKQIETWIDGAQKVLSIAGGDNRIAQDDPLLALQFCFSHPAVSSVIPGILTPKEARSNAEAGRRSPLSAEIVRAIQNANAQTDFFVR